MGWTSPRTWATSELVTAAMLNTHVRDDVDHLHDRLLSVYDYAVPTYGFDGTSLEAEWAWGAVATEVTPEVVSVSDSYLQCAFGTGQGTKSAFLYLTTALATERLGRFGLASGSDEAYIGLAWTDATLNNAVYWILKKDTGSWTWATQLWTRIGGGAWTGTEIVTGLPLGVQQCLRLVIGGTPWSGWGITLYQGVDMVHMQMVLGYTGGFVFTPTRRGIVMSNSQVTNADTWREFHCDWYT